MDAPARISPVGAVLLAAGQSRRMGSPKQLLSFAGTTLLRHACEMALASAARPVVVVLGANDEACRAEIADMPVTCVHNPDWAEGIGGSLRVGVAGLLDLAPESAGVLVMLCDQPLVETEDLAALLAAWSPPRRLISAAAYHGVGVPAVFDRTLFHELMSLKGHQGARQMIARYAARTATVDILAAARDIDTRADYEQLPQR